MIKTLIVDDFPDSSLPIQRALEEVCEFEIIQEPKKAISRDDLDKFDAFLIDINMPLMKGDKVVESLRKIVNKPSPFCLMTSEDFDYSITKYHSYLIDEFLSKDASLSEIKSRFSAVYERTKMFARILEKGPIRLNLSKAKVFVRNQEIECTSIEYRILCNLIIGLLDKEYVPRDSFVENVWGGTSVEERTISTHISNLNKKLSEFDVKVKTKRFKGLFVS